MYVCHENLEFVSAAGCCQSAIECKYAQIPFSVFSDSCVAVVAGGQASNQLVLTLR